MGRGQVFFISIPGIFNAISTGIEHGRGTEAQETLNTVFIASNLLVSLSMMAFLTATLLLNRMTLHPWRVLPPFILVAAYFVGCAYDSLAHLVPNKSLPLLVEVATRLAPGPMAILSDIKPIFMAASIILAIVIMVRESVHSRR
jgi:hypothetical protein